MLKNTSTGIFDYPSVLTLNIIIIQYLSELFRLWQRFHFNKIQGTGSKDQQGTQEAIGADYFNLDLV